MNFVNEIWRVTRDYNLFRGRWLSLKLGILQIGVRASRVKVSGLQLALGLSLRTVVVGKNLAFRGGDWQGRAMTVPSKWRARVCLCGGISRPPAPFRRSSESIGPS